LNKAAEALMQETGIAAPSTIIPKNRLLHTVFPQTFEEDPLDKFMDTLDDDRKEVEDELFPREKVFPEFATRFISASKSSLRCAAFSWAGDYAATAADDCSVKILEVDKMHTHVDIKGEKQSEYENARPVLRTFYDHNRVDFSVFPPLELNLTFRLAC
jgi:hypothetical protein